MGQPEVGIGGWNRMGPKPHEKKSCCTPHSGALLLFAGMRGALGFRVEG